MAVNKTRIGGLVIGVNVLLAAIWWVVPLWMYGVFDDGLFYSSIARNLVYDAQESIWDLKVTNTLDHHFNGHPPMSFWVEALLYKLVGDVYWVDRVYSLLLALGAMALLAACWRLWQPKDARLPLLFWLSVSIVGWSFGNNMLENLLTVTTTAAVYVLLRQAQQGRKNWSWIVLAAWLIGAALMTKGPVGLYPLCVPLLYALVLEQGRWKRALLETLVLIGVIIGSYYMMIMVWPRAHTYLATYWDMQLGATLAGKMDMTDGRWAVLQALVEESLPPLIVGLLLLGIARYLKLPLQQINKKAALFFLLLAFAASLPFLLSPKQLRFYIVPSMVWYALAWGMVCYPAYLAVADYTQHWRKRRQAFAGLLAVGIGVCLVLSYYNKGKVARQVDFLVDAHSIGQVVPPHTEIQITGSLYDKWGLHGYLYRYFYIDLDMTYRQQPYALGLKGEALEQPVFQPTADSLRVLQLHQEMD